MAKTVNSKIRAIAIMPIVLFFRRISEDKPLATGTSITAYSQY
jgi:hypothetical protein